MPQTAAQKTRYMRGYMQDRRAQERLLRASTVLPRSGDLFEPPAGPESEYSADDIRDRPADVLAHWAESTLTIPDGPLRGEPFKIAPWQVEFLRGALAPGVRESGLSVARKNGKTGFIAALLLCYLAGPLNRPQWRAAVTSLTGELAKELRRAVQLTAEASGLASIRVYVSPTPGRVIGAKGAQLDILAADKSSGHARGGDLAIIDEAGLLNEKHRELWGAMFSSLSGRNGRLMAISIRGDCPMFSSLAERADSGTVHWQEFAAPEDSPLDCEAGWRAGNPGIADGIKSLQYMRDAAARAMSSPADASTFRAHDLNQPQDPARELVVSLQQWKACVCTEIAPTDGPCFIGVDLGGAVSMTAAAAYWPMSGRLHVRAAFGDTPGLPKRGELDGVGNLYSMMEQRGELVVYPGELTPVGSFLEDFIGEIDRGSVASISADRFRQSELRTAVSGTFISIPPDWRGMGWKDSSEDVRNFQRAVIAGNVACPESLLIASAIRDSAVARDAAGNGKLDKARARGRIDALQAAVLAVSAGMRAPGIVGAASFVIV